MPWLTLLAAPAFTLGLRLFGLGDFHHHKAVLYLSAGAVWLLLLALRRIPRLGPAAGRALGRWIAMDPAIAILVWAAALWSPLPALAAGAAVALIARDLNRGGLPALCGRRAQAILAATFVVFIWFISYAGGDLLQGDLYGSAFDSLGLHLLRGDAAVAPATIDTEGFLINGRSYIYFGPFPALLRIVPNLLIPALIGRWSRASCLLAAMLAVWAFARILRLALAANRRLDERRRRFLFDASLLGFGLGTPLLHVMSSAFIYSEAILWASCWLLWGLFHALALILERKRRSIHLLGLSAAAGFTLLSRVTFGFFSGVILALAAAAQILRRFRGRRENGGAAIGPGRLALLLLPAVLAVCFQLWYNQARFGSPTTFIAFESYGSKLDARGSSLREIGGTMNPRRIPTALRRYFLPEPDYFVGHAPFARLLVLDDVDRELYTNGFPGGVQMKVIPLTIVSLWLVLGAAAGLVALARLRRERLLAWGVAAALAGQCLLILSYYWITQRYALELVPLLIFLYAFFLTACPPGKPRRVDPLIAAGWAVVLLSVAATAASTLDFVSLVRWGMPQEYALMVQKGLRVVDALLGLAGMPR